MFSAIIASMKEGMVRFAVSRLCARAGPVTAGGATKRLLQPVCPLDCEVSTPSGIRGHSGMGAEGTPQAVVAPSTTISAPLT